VTDTDHQATLKAFAPRHEFFIGIDSDGCAFDTMEVKHKECFCPACTEVWGHQAIARYSREAWDFINLYSKQRGCNRWLALTQVFDLLRERAEVRQRGVPICEAKALHEFIEASREPGSDIALSNDGLIRFILRRTEGDEAVKAVLDTIRENVFGVILDGVDAFLEGCPGDAALKELLRGAVWTHYVNFTVAHLVHDVPPFPYVRESLQKAAPKADLIVVSATPYEALKREWEEHDIAQFTAVIAGQEQGKKAEHLAICAGGKYEKDRVLMVGDAPGDMKAARANDALFYPVNPGAEADSWQRFHDEALDRFLAGTYAGDYEADLIAEFETFLPETPPWKD